MKKYIFLLAILLQLYTIYSCKKKSCENVFCGSARQCFEGECYCADGLEGDNCDQFANKKYVGNYLVIEQQCNAGQGFLGGGTYQTYLDSFPNNRARLRMNNFLNLINDVVIFIRTDKSNRGNTVEIPTQNFGNVRLYGIGTYTPQNGRININIEYSVGGVNYACTHVFYPQ
ncbi:MAG: hypothetical protein RMJ53_04045 [Chitinophagales bacterium]|nr:hypothetical protein [Chitinophagales bacterium]MDW8273386.1 hypothetical protein [Chitinophagales bacterium]